MPRFALLLRDEGNFPTDISPEEIQNLIARYREWRRGMGGTGEKLEDGTGKVVKKSNGRLTVTDGPYAEAKEILGGFMMIEAPSYEAAVEHCRNSPHLEFGSIEVRQIDAV
jgi:hypothetical protein